MPPLVAEGRLPLSVVGGNGRRPCSPKLDAHGRPGGGLKAMVELVYVYATAGVIAAYFLAQVVSRRFDPFAPTWLFLVGYVQLYVIQPLSYHDWAVATRGVEVVAATNWRALWALLWFLAVYHLGPGRRVAPALPRPPRSWSPACVWVLCPPLILWGLYCSGVMLRAGDDATRPISPEEV